MQKKLLIIGQTFPEPTTTAAGQRMLQLIKVFLRQNYKIYFGSTASKSPHTIDFNSLGISSEILQLNNGSFDDYIIKCDPQIVLFDRFITEEQFGWRVAEQCPKALKILDTEDLHFLRKARRDAFKKDGHLNDVNLFSDTAKREIASILRCDLSLIISEIEMNLLINTFKISDKLLQYVPFMVEELIDKTSIPTYEEREEFMTIGNFYHKPNVDSVLYLKTDIWPQIKKRLPKATLSIYGNYAPQQILEMHNENDGFLIKGWAPNVALAFNNAKVCLVPLRFGAGLKGKLLDAMFYGTPAVTTTIGAEGMYEPENGAENIGDNTANFVKLSILLYTDKNKWLKCQQAGFDNLKDRFNGKKISEKLVKRIVTIYQHLDDHRHEHFIGQILQHQTLQSTKYMSKWIEEKNNN